MMAAYINGSLALEERNGQRIDDAKAKRAVYRRKTLPIHEKLLYLFTVIACVVVAGAIIWRYAQIYEMNTHIQQIEREMKLLQAENNKLKLEIGRLSSPERFQKEAAKFGLVPNDQQVSISAASSKTTMHDKLAALNKR